MSISTTNLAIAFRHLAKYRFYTFINIVGLTIGFSLYLFSHILVEYESDHDHMFSNRDRIFAISSVFEESADIPIREYPDIRLAYAPLFSSGLPEAEHVVRSIQRERVISIAGISGYESIRFVDPGYTDLFDFRYRLGDATALDGDNGVVITSSSAQRLFGRVDVLGETLRLNHEYELSIRAVIEDVAADSHLNSSLLPNTKLSLIAPVAALKSIDDYDPDSDWDSLFPGDLTYIQLPSHLGRDWLQQRIDDLAARYTPPNDYDTISGLRVRPIVEINSAVWESLGFPILESIRLLGLLMLITACLNYTNLATAQSFGRSREVGLRKSFGASRPQLLIQFLFESLLLACCAMLLSVAIIDLLVPAYNNWSGKGVRVDYTAFMPGLLFTTGLVGLMSGAYPAWLITRESPVDSLNNRLVRGRRGNVIRNLMIAGQFSISIFILAMVMIIFFQNRLVFGMTEVFPKASIMVLERLDETSIIDKHDDLRTALSDIEGVSQVSLSAAVPFNDYESFRTVSAIDGDEDQSISMRLIAIDSAFRQSYNIDLTTGRALDPAIAGDRFDPDRAEVSVLLNQVAASRLGLGQGSAVLGKTFYKLPESDYPEPRQYRVVGMLPDQYFLGVHMPVRPMAFYLRPDRYAYASVSYDHGRAEEVEAAIRSVWAGLITDYPVRIRTLDTYLNRFFRIPSGISDVLAIAAVVALSLALIGLFGLAAFMAQRRTREIGIRKVMGASSRQITRLLIWQISLPVLWSILIAMPLAWLASQTYLDFFPERISFVIPVIILASLLALLCAWGIVAIHAGSVARTRPVESLRYE